MYEKYKQKTKLLDFSSLEIIIKNTTKQNDEQLHFKDFQ